MTNRNDSNKNDFVNKEKSEEKTSFQVVEDGNAVRKEINQEQIPIHHRPVSSIKQKKNKWLMPVLITIATAGVIGTALGMFILQLFVGLEEEEVSSIRGQENTKNAGSESTASKGVEIPALSAYVLQVGVFSEQENANEWKDYYEAAGENSFIWEREEQYYLFIGIFGTENQATSKVEELQANDVDVFMKEWTTGEKNATELSDEEREWLEQFQATWDEALAEKEDTSLLDLAEQIPPSTTLETLGKELATPSEQTDLFFFKLMVAYEKL